MEYHSKGYDIVAKLLHWVITVLVFVIIAIALFMTPYFKWHKSFGMLVGLLMLIRIVWQATHRVEPLPASVPRWQVTAARIVQGSMYLLLLMLPILGFVASSLSGRPLAFFGLTIPAWLQPNHTLSEQLFEVHSILAWALITLIGVHLLGAIQHYFARDGVLKRMWF